jgi:hypothetical protein
MISTPKVMVSIFWSPLGFPVTPALRLRTTFIAAYLCSGIIPKIVERLPFDMAKSPRQVMLHMDNAIHHRARESITDLTKCRIRPINHPPYCPDLVPSAFYLFGKLKGALAGQEFDSTEKSLLVIRGSLTLSDGPSPNRSLMLAIGD